eukprot:Pgem_evm1s4102
MNLRQEQESSNIPKTPSSSPTALSTSTSNLSSKSAKLASITEKTKKITLTPVDIRIQTATSNSTPILTTSSSLNISDDQKFTLKKKESKKKEERIKDLNTPRADTIKSKKLISTMNNTNNNYSSRQSRQIQPPPTQHALQNQTQNQNKQQNPQIIRVGASGTSFYVFIVSALALGLPIRVKMNEYDHIEALRRRLSRKTGIPVTCQTLLYKGNILRSGTVKDNGLYPGCLISLFPRIEAGLLDNYHNGPTAPLTSIDQQKQHNYHQQKLQNNGRPPIQQ